jgi:hypothetical protein
VAAPSAWGVPPNLVAAAGGLHDLRAGLAATCDGAPALLVAAPSGAATRALLVLPGDDLRAAQRWARNACRATHPADPWSWATAAPLLAGLARGLLLRGTRRARGDLEMLLGAGLRQVRLGGEHPLDARWARADEDLEDAPPVFTTPAARRGALLVVGLGSLGSVAAELLAPWAERFVLADPDTVDAVNPARQAYDLADIGRPKAEALRGRLLHLGARDVTALSAALTDEAQVAGLVQSHGVTAALVATGTRADFAAARALRERNVAHVVARCYPRARYWEAVLVDGARGPGLEDIRGRVAPGPAAPPTPEQRAAYSDSGALEAEPATLAESGWAAAWAARLTAQLLAPAGLRERWLLELLAAGRTCLVGGAHAEMTHAGPAYAVARPGEIHAWGQEGVRG